MSSFTDIRKPYIYLITKGNLTHENYSTESIKTLQNIKSAKDFGISFIQIREKQLSAKLSFELTSEIIKITKNSATKILVNERADIALAAKADGVHLTSNALPTSLIRRKFPNNFIIGVSTHTLEKAEKAKDEGADFVTFSPIFPTISKPNYGKPQGLENLREVCEKLKPFPIIALGGIDKTNYRTVLENGASGFAGISFFDEFRGVLL